MPVVKLEGRLTAYPAVEGYSHASVPALEGVCLAGHDTCRVDAPEQSEANSKAQDGEHDPVRSHPENELDVVVVPAVTQVVCEEAPAIPVVLGGEEDADAVQTVWVEFVVVAPDDAKVQRTGRGHDGDVREGPAAVVIRQAINGVEEELVARHRAHGVVGNARGGSLAHPGGVGQERVEAAVASLRSCQRCGSAERPAVRTSSKSM